MSPMKPKKGRPKSGRALGHQLNLRVSGELLARLEAVAKRDRRKPGEWARLALETALGLDREPMGSAVALGPDYTCTSEELYGRAARAVVAVTVPGGEEIQADCTCPAGWFDEHEPSPRFPTGRPRLNPDNGENHQVGCPRGDALCGH